MIHYQLRCCSAHEFDAWFRDSAAYEHQAAAGLLECPRCGERQVVRALMAPALPRRGQSVSLAARSPMVAGAPSAAVRDEERQQKPPSPARSRLPDELRAALLRLRGEVERNCDYVGPDFAEEARRIHDGESPSRGIYGEASADEAAALAEDGIEVACIPWLRRADA